jgi:5-formyltetrahydrofolate cyclo-ligase
MTSEKNDIRQYAKGHRDQLQNNPDWPDWADQAADVFFQSIPLTEQTIISAYFPVGSELDVSPLVEILWQKGHSVCLPIIQGSGKPLLFAQWKKTTALEKGQMGIFEPVEKLEVTPDILIVPLLAFDTQGNRIGYGQGHYDATIAELRQKKSILAIGMAYAEQAVLLALPTEPHDQKLDFVVTQQRIFDFRR